MIKRNVTTMRRARGSLSAGAVLVGAALMLSLPAGPALAAPVSVQDTTETVIGHAPTATPTLSSTSPVAGDTLTVASGFNDVDGDKELGTTYQW